jgi:hypothetical protein
VAEIGESLADQRLRGVDQEDRGLEPAEALDELGLLPDVLRVVARIARAPPDGRGRRRERKVGADVEPERRPPSYQL